MPHPVGCTCYNCNLEAEYRRRADARKAGRAADVVPPGRVLDLLEELLGLTEDCRPHMTRDESTRWGEISAECADIREGIDARA